MRCKRRVTRQYVSWAIAGKSSKEHYLHYLIGVVCNEIFCDVALLFEHPIAWTAWHLKLVWSSLVADVQTQAKWVVAIVSMSMQIASIEDTRPKSAWTSPLRKSWYGFVYHLRLLKLAVASQLEAFWETIFGLPSFASREI